MALMVAFGTMSLLSDGAARSFLPRLVPRASLLAANARLDQSSSVAQTSGPLLAGGLVTALGAPVAVLVDAVSYLVSGIAMATIRTPEISSIADDQPRNLRREIGDGLRWVYRHRVLAPIAISTHGWFLFNSILTTAGRTVTACRALYPLAWAVIVLVPDQANTPDELQGRMGTTIRSVNRAMIVVGAPSDALDHAVT